MRASGARIGCLTGAILIARCAFAQSGAEVSAAIDDIASAALRDGPIAGLSIEVDKGERVLVRKGYGESNLELQTPATAETVYHIASITKTLTAAAVVQLAEQHKLSLDDPVAKYVPEARGIAVGATVRSLLNHTSGIPDYTALGQKSDNIEAVPFTKERFFAILEGEKPLFAAGQLWRYGNSGYYLLGLAIERASGQTYASYMMEHLFRPNGMVSTRYCESRSIVMKRAAGYVASGGTLVNADPMTWETAFSAASICSTVSDLVRWQRASSDGRVISASGLALMRKATELGDGTKVDYGLSTRRGSLVGQTGSGGGFNTVLEYYPEDELSVAVLCNSQSSVSALDLAGRAARAALGIKTSEAKPVQLPQSEAEGYAGHFDSAEGPVIVFSERGDLRVRFSEPDRRSR